jgi:hypothetical protein
LSKHAQITRSHVVYGAEQETHVRVEIFEVVAPGIRRRLDSLDLALRGASDDQAAIRDSVEFSLLQAGLLADGDRVLTEPEARAAIMQGVSP